MPDLAAISQTNPCSRSTHIVHFLILFFEISLSAGVPADCTPAKAIERSDVKSRLLYGNLNFRKIDPFGVWPAKFHVQAMAGVWGGLADLGQSAPVSSLSRPASWRPAHEETRIHSIKREPFTVCPGRLYPGAWAALC